MKQNLILIGEVDLEVKIVMLVVEKALVLGGIEFRKFGCYSCGDSGEGGVCSGGCHGDSGGGVVIKLRNFRILYALQAIKIYHTKHILV